MNNLPKTVTRQRRDCDLNLGPSVPQSSTLTTQLPSHPINAVGCCINDVGCHLPPIKWNLEKAPWFWEATTITYVKHYSSKQRLH